MVQSIDENPKTSPLLEGIRPTCLKEQVTNMILTHGKPEKHHSASYLFKVCMEEAIRATPYLRFISKLLKEKKGSMREEDTSFVAEKDKKNDHCNDFGN